MKVLFAGGGTGGHVFPAVAIAQAVQRLEERSEVVFVGTANRLEARVLPRLGYRFHTIWISGIRRAYALENLLFPFKLCVALIQSLNIVRREKPDVVVGTGGYVSGPVLLVSALLKYPTIVQEQNSYPGIATRLLARFVDEVHVAFEYSRTYLRRAKTIHVSGNPVRSGETGVSPAEARQFFNLDPDTRTLLVVGGSLGATAINDAILTALPRLMKGRWQVIWQTGEGDCANVKTETRPWHARVSVHAFIDDMYRAYTASDLVVCRAGATTIAEITNIGKASIFIPYPHAAADHQYHNARILADAGAAILLRESDMNELEGMIVSLMTDEEKRRRIEREAKLFGKPDAARVIAESILKRSRMSKNQEAYSRT